MIPAQFTKLIAELEGLTDSQVRYVDKLLKGTDTASQLITEFEERMVESPECPHCNTQENRSARNPGTRQRKLKPS